MVQRISGFFAREGHPVGSAQADQWEDGQHRLRQRRKAEKVCTSLAVQSPQAYSYFKEHFADGLMYGASSVKKQLAKCADVPSEPSMVNCNGVPYPVSLPDLSKEAVAERIRKLPFEKGQRWVIAADEKALVPTVTMLKYSGPAVCRVLPYMGVLPHMGVFAYMGVLPDVGDYGSMGVLPCMGERKQITVLLITHSSQAFPAES